MGIGYVVGGDVGRQRQVDEHVVGHFSRQQFAALLRLAPFDGLRQQPGVHVEANVGDVAALLAAQKVARAADFHVAHGDEVARA